MAAWFDQAVLEEIERVHHALGQIEPTLACILGACASDLLRDYSQQDPMDLRIRRRKSPLPKKPFLDAFAESVERFISRTESARETLKGAGIGKAILLDSRDISLRKLGMRTPFDCAVTSPPYATALPYIDTQRLSLVWLGLTPPSEIQSLEATLVGSRESRGHERKRLAEALENNPAELPDSQIDYCRTLMRALGPSDGFRRKAVPTLLYRYFEGMAASFRGVRSV
ncbi:MAG TPA: hypothetical protein VGU23_02330, partial [Acidobacteriaceae bacterium]|nr:hypothetical protein [Acidobacteriaceae bacterium]